MVTLFQFQADTVNTLLEQVRCELHRTVKVGVFCGDYNLKNKHASIFVTLEILFHKIHRIFHDNDMPNKDTNHNNLCLYVFPENLESLPVKDILQQTFPELFCCLLARKTNPDFFQSNCV